MEVELTEMKSCLFVIQQAANVQHIEQAIDAALVAAIFDQHPVVLFLNENKSMDTVKQKAASTTRSLTDKLAQLKDMQVSLINADALDTASFRAYFNKADVILSY